MEGAAPNLGVPRPLLILILILLLSGWSHPQSPPPGCAECTSPPAPSPTPSERPSPLSVATTSPSCPARSGGLLVLPGPTSRSGHVGHPLTLRCQFQAPSGAPVSVTWLQVCPPRYRGHSWTCSWPQEVVATEGDRQVAQEGEGNVTLTFLALSHNDSGLYFCRVRSERGDSARSCGTFVRVSDPQPVPFLQLRESTKNRILTAQGVLLLLCMAGPGLLLLCRRRWANEQLPQAKKSSCEEENLYEGLNLDECSMYEDISRGVQPTYEDVGTLPEEAQLEKP